MWQMRNVLPYASCREQELIQLTCWELTKIIIKNKKYANEKKHGNSRQSNQDTGCSRSGCTLFYKRNFGYSGNNTFSLVSNICCDKLSGYLPALHANWSQHQEKRIKQKAGMNRLLFI